MTQPQISIIDLGSAYTRSGFAGDDMPRATMVTACGHARAKSQLENKLYFADDLENKRSQFKIGFPVEHGRVTNWDDVQSLVRQTYTQELHIDSSECVAFITEQPRCPRDARAKMCQMLIEKFQAKGFYSGLAQQLAIYASGETTGTIVDVGEGQTSIVPVFEGVQLAHALRQGDISGKELTNELFKLIREYDASFQQDPWLLREIKQQINLQDGYLQYELPDGNKVRMLSLKSADEVPKLLFEGEKSLQKLIQASIKCCDPDLQKMLSQNICLSGGSTCFIGFEEKMNDELQKETHESWQVVPLEDRENATFVGCSILASLDQFKDFYVSSQEVQEHGADVISQKWL